MIVWTKNCLKTSKHLIKSFSKLATLCIAILKIDRLSKVLTLKAIWADNNKFVNWNRLIKQSNICLTLNSQTILQNCLNLVNVLSGLW